MKNYGRRIQINGEVTWCELTEHDVLDTLRANIRLNAAIYQQCLHEALERLHVRNTEGDATLAAQPHVRDEAHALATSLYEQCAVKSFVALQAALDRRVHEEKSSVMH